MFVPFYIVITVYVFHAITLFVHDLYLCPLKLMCYQIILLQVLITGNNVALIGTCNTSLPNEAYSHTHSHSVTTFPFSPKPSIMNTLNYKHQDKANRRRAKCGNAEVRNAIDMVPEAVYFKGLAEMEKKQVVL